MPVLDIMARTESRITAAGIVERISQVSDRRYERKTGPTKRLLALGAVVHATHNPRFGTKAAAEAEFLRDSPAVSAHFLIGRDSRLYWITNLNRIAWHAGRSKPPFTNDNSVGIEVHSSVRKDTPTGPWISEPLLPGQRQILVDLLSMLAWQFAWVSPEHVARHADVALPAGRKFDPHCIPPADFSKILSEVWWFDKPAPSVLS